MLLTRGKLTSKLMLPTLARKQLLNRQLRERPKLQLKHKSRKKLQLKLESRLHLKVNKMRF